MKKAILFLILAVAAFAQNVNVQKAGDGTNNITANLAFGSGRTLTFRSGSTLDLQNGTTINWPTGLIPWVAVNKTGASLADLPTRLFSDLQSKPTTLAGYGVTNGAYLDLVGAANSPYVGFDLAGGTGGIGRLTWNPSFETLDIGLNSQVTLQIGQEQVVRILNTTGSTLTDGQLVYISGAQGQRPTVTLAQANTAVSSARTIGMVTQSIANNAQGFVTVSGVVNNVNTSGLADGTLLWLSATTPGGYTATQPSAPDHAVVVGYVVKGGSVGGGSIFVSILNGWSLIGLHDVSITSPVNNQSLLYDSVSGLWKNSFVPISSGVSGLGTGVATALGTNVGSAGSPVVNGGVLGTPSSGTLTNATGLPLSTGVTGTLGVTNGGSGLNSATLGDIRYGSGTNTITALAGNTTTTKKFLSQTGTGTVSAAPSWSTVSASDIDLVGTNGLVARTAAATYAARTITGTSNQVTVANGDGAAGNPTLSLPQDIATSSSPTFAAVNHAGSAGAGYAGFSAQSVAPSIPAGGFRQYADSTGRFSWIRASDGFTRTWDATLTANRVYTLPDATGTLALTATTVPSIAGTAGQVLVNGGTAAVQGSAATLSLPSTITQATKFDANLATASGRTFTLTDLVFSRITSTEGRIAAQYFGLSAAAGTTRGWTVLTGSNARWVAGADSSAESGSNVGSDYVLSRYSDIGVLIDSPFKVARGDGKLTASGVAAFTNTTASISTITGSATFGGGIGVAGAGYFGGNLISTATTAATGAANTGALQVGGGGWFNGNVVATGVHFRAKSANGTTASPVEDQISGFTNTNGALQGAGVYALNSLTDNSAVWLRFKTINSAGNAATALTLNNDQSATFTGSALSTSATGGVGYGTGAGGTVTQATSRTTGVTINKVCGSITLVSAAGSTSWQTFTVTNSAVAATDVVHVTQKSGADKYQIFVTNTGTGTFDITFATTGGTTTEQPVFNFAVIKAVSS